jgi:hypothetical protein
MVGCLAGAAVGCSPRPAAVAPTPTAADATPALRPAPSTAPSAADPLDAPSDPATLLRRLASAPSLRLTTDRNSAATRFRFLSRVVTQTAGVERMANVMVVRDDARVAMLCMSAGGLPYCYATRGFFVCLDPARAGGVVVFHGGAPGFTLSVTPGTDRLVDQFYYLSRKADPAIDVDLGSLLRGVQEKLRSVEFDADGRSLRARTENAVVLVSPARSDPPQAHRFPVTDFSMESLRTRNTVMLVGIATDSPPPFDLDAVTDASVRKLGLPVRNLTADDVRTIDLAVPVDFGKNPAEARAALRLRELIDPTPPAPNPRGRPDPKRQAVHVRDARSAGMSQPAYGYAS